MKNNNKKSDIYEVDFFLLPNANIAFGLWKKVLKPYDSFSFYSQLMSKRLVIVSP